MTFAICGHPKSANDSFIKIIIIKSCGTDRRKSGGEQDFHPASCDHIEALYRKLGLYIHPFCILHYTGYAERGVGEGCVLPCSPLQSLGSLVMCGGVRKRPMVRTPACLYMKIHPKYNIVDLFIFIPIFMRTIFVVFHAIIANLFILMVR